MDSRWHDPDWERTSLRQLIDELPDLVCRYTPDGTLLYVNKAYAAFHGRDRAAMLHRPFPEFVDDEVRPAIQRALQLMQHIRPSDPVRRSTHRSVAASGAHRWHEWTDQAFFDARGTLVGFLSVGRDVTDALQAARETQHALLHDDLTGVLNRRGTMTELGDRLARAPRPFPVGYGDIDRFKALNDRHGHGVGDEVLAGVAAALQRSSPDGVVGRIGGDEFVLVLPDEDVDLPALEARLARGLADIRPLVTLSIGWARATPGETGEEVLARADLDMYRRRRRARPTG